MLNNQAASWLDVKKKINCWKLTRKPNITAPARDRKNSLQSKYNITREYNSVLQLYLDSFIQGIETPTHSKEIYFAILQNCIPAWTQSTILETWMVIQLHILEFTAELIVIKIFSRTKALILQFSGVVNNVNLKKTPQN